MELNEVLFLKKAKGREFENRVEFILKIKRFSLRLIEIRLHTIMQCVRIQRCLSISLPPLGFQMNNTQFS